MLQHLGTRPRIHTYLLDTIQEPHTYAVIGNHHFFTKTCHHQTYQNYQGPLLSQYINAIYVVLVLQRSLIILVGLMMKWYIEKMMIHFHAQLEQKILNGIYYLLI